VSLPDTILTYPCVRAEVCLNISIQSVMDVTNYFPKIFLIQVHPVLCISRITQRSLPINISVGLYNAYELQVLYAINHLLIFIFHIQVHLISCNSEIMQEFLLIKIAIYFVTNQARIIKSFNSIHVYNRPI